ncbi:unnamed protein product [Ilex paraguariensis]
MRSISPVKCSHNRSGQPNSNHVEKNAGKKEHHLWKKRDSTSSGQKALNLVRIVSGLPNEKEAIYGALDKWTAWETEFPLIAATKALRILRKRNQWIRVIQVWHIQNSFQIVELVQRPMCDDMLQLMQFLFLSCFLNLR